MPPLTLVVCGSTEERGGGKKISSFGYNDTVNPLHDFVALLALLLFLSCVFFFLILFPDVPFCLVKTFKF